MSYFKPKRKKGNFLKTLIFIVLIWAIAGTYFSYKATKKIEKLKYPGKEIKILSIIKFFPSYTRELKNVGLILENKTVSEQKGWLFTSTYKKVLDGVLLMSDINRFKKLSEYLDLSRKEDLKKYYGLYLFNRGEFEKAKPLLTSIEDFKTVYSTNKIPVIKNILFFDIKEKKYVSKYKGLKFLETLFPEKRDFLVCYTSRIVPAIQDLAEVTLGDNKGFFAIAIQDSIIAMVANGVNPVKNYFEPGSVIKLITLTGYLQEGRNDVSFPFYCNKPLNIDGKPFYDWKKHGKINSFADALACSCNLVFGECGLSLGKNSLLKWYSKFYIDNNKKITLCEYTFAPGKLKKDIENRYELADAGIGLEIPEVTPYWLIKTASVYARNGKNGNPDCTLFKFILGVKDSKTIDFPFSEIGKDYIFDKNKVAQVYEGMKLAVDSPEGTGKRAKTEGMDIILKTGTAGNKPFNAFIIGCAKYPDANTNFSFALMLKNGGKAEYKAAQLIRSFFASFKNLKKEQWLKK